MTVVSTCLLIDSSCATAGYVEDVNGDLTVDAQHIVKLCHDFGVGAVRDIGSGISARLRFYAVRNAPKIVGGSVAVTDSAPLSRNELMITRREQLDDIVGLCIAMDERWIGVRSSQLDFFGAVHAATLQAGIRIHGRGSGVKAAVQSGFVTHVDGVAALLPSQVSPIDAISSAADVDGATWSGLTQMLVERSVSVATGLVSLRRAAFLKEAIQAPYLENLVPIIPHARYLQRMRQGAGYLAGKRVLEAHSGIREPSGHERRVADEGWERIAGWVADAVQAGVVFLPASKAPQLAVLPGYGLLEELALLAHIAIEPADGITLATATAADVLGTSVIPGTLTVPGELTRDSLLSLTPSVLRPCAELDS